MKNNLVYIFVFNIPIVSIILFKKKKAENLYSGDEKSSFESENTS